MGSRLNNLFRPFLAGLVVTMMWLTVGASAHAASVTYTFKGVGNGTVDTMAFSGDFTFVFTADTSNITSGGGEFFQRNIGGTFSTSGFSGTLLTDNAIAVNNDPATPRLGFFNSSFDNGGTIQNSSFTAYHLDTSFGPVTGTGADLLPTLNADGHGFGTAGGQTVELLGITSLTFTATLQSVPEPSTLVLLGTGLLGGFAIFVRQRKTT